jgi:hypothetical protein
MRIKIATLIAVALVVATPTLADVPIEPGATATVKLSPQGDLAYPVAPKPPHAPANFGAILSTDIEQAGLYHVALGATGWIDVIRDGKALESVGHRHGDAGSGIAKIVDFNLVPGHYVVALSGLTAGEVSISIRR